VRKHFSLSYVNRLREQAYEVEGQAGPPHSPQGDPPPGRRSGSHLSCPRRSGEARVHRTARRPHCEETAAGPWVRKQFRY
jgi:hypothetical protein